MDPRTTQGKAERLIKRITNRANRVLRKHHNIFGELIEDDLTRMSRDVLKLFELSREKARGN